MLFRSAPRAPEGPRPPTLTCWRGAKPAEAATTKISKKSSCNELQRCLAFVDCLRMTPCPRNRVSPALAFYELDSLELDIQVMSYELDIPSLLYHPYSHCPSWKRGPRNTLLSWLA